MVKGKTNTLCFVSNETKDEDIVQHRDVVESRAIAHMKDIEKLFFVHLSFLLQTKISSLGATLNIRYEIGNSANSPPRFSIFQRVRNMVDQMFGNHDRNVQFLGQKILSIRFHFLSPSLSLSDMFIITYHYYQR